MSEKIVQLNEEVIKPANKMSSPELNLSKKYAGQAKEEKCITKRPP